MGVVANEDELSLVIPSQAVCKKFQGLLLATATFYHFTELVTVQSVPEDFPLGPGGRKIWVPGFNSSGLYEIRYGANNPFIHYESWLKPLLVLHDTDVTQFGVLYVSGKRT